MTDIVICILPKIDPDAPNWKYKENDTASRVRNYKEVLSLVETLHNEKSDWLQTKDMNLYIENLKNG